MRRYFTVVAALLLVAAPALAQYEVSGQLDIVKRNQSAGDWSNKTFRQYSNFDFVRARIFFDAQASEAATVFTQVLINNSSLNVYAAYLRLSRIGGKNLNLHAGLIPNPVGLWGQRTYSDKNPLIGVPLMYAYHAALSPGPDQTDLDDLFSSRGRGHAIHGLPIIYDACWNTGIDLFGSAGPFDWSIAALSGAVSAPAIQPEKKTPQLTSKLSFVPSPALLVSGFGFAGPYQASFSIDSEIAYGGASAGQESAEDYMNLGAGIGINFASGYLELLTEIVWSRWEHPVYHDLDAASAYLDARLKFAPQWYVAGRIETMRFSRINFGDLRGSQHWDYPVDRIEFGIGHRIDSSVLLKLVSQIIRSGEADFLDDEIVAVQLSTTIH